MVDLFGSDLARVQPGYGSCIATLERRHASFSPVWAGCRRRAGFLLPVMLAEYAHHAGVGRFPPEELRELELSLGLCALAVCIDDDVVDELSGDIVASVDHVSAAELVQAFAYSRLVDSPHPLRVPVARELDALLDSVTRHQQLDARNIADFSAGEFDLHRYLAATYKTGSLATAGLRLGLLLAGSPPGPEVEQLGRAIGTVVQLIDDTLDLDDDLRSHGRPITLPMQLAHAGSGPEPVQHLIDDALGQADKLSAAVGNGQHLRRLVGRFRVVARSLHAR